MRYVIAIFTALAASFIAIGANSALEQQHLLESVRPVQGTVSSAEVREFSTTDPKSRREITYRPFVTYHYALGGSIFGNNKVFPITSDTSAPRAQQIVNRSPPGATVTVWCDPANPAKSFLLREWDF